MFRVKPKVRLAFIENESARRETFRKRRKGLLKKIQELSVLCDVEACGVVYSPYAEEPEVWPSAAEARRLVAVLGELPETDYVTRKFTHKTYLQDRLAKVEEQLEKENKEVTEREKTKVMNRHVGNIVLHGTTRLEELDELSSKDLKDLVSLVDKKLREIDHQKTRKNITGPPPPEKPATANNIAVAGGSETGSSAQQANIVTCSDDDFNFWPDNNYSLADLFPPSS